MTTEVSNLLSHAVLEASSFEPQTLNPKEAHLSSGPHDSTTEARGSTSGNQQLIPGEHQGGRSFSGGHPHQPSPPLLPFPKAEVLVLEWT